MFSLPYNVEYNSTYIFAKVCQNDGLELFQCKVDAVAPPLLYQVLLKPPLVEFGVQRHGYGFSHCMTSVMRPYVL